MEKQDYEKTLSTQAYLNVDGPGALDSQVFFSLKGKAPNKKKSPNMYRWYCTLV